VEKAVRISKLGIVAACLPAALVITTLAIVPVSSAPSGLGRFRDPGQVTYSTRLHPGECHARGQLPDPRCTPGSIDTVVTQANIHSTICTVGYTKKIRPPSSQTAALKYDTSYPAYSIPAGAKGEEDHLVPLELGGSNDVTNLWPEAGSIPNRKDTAENAARRAVCDGRMSLAAAQEAIASNWIRLGQKLGVT
jgi:hypothetical protein